jgi:hypothetical protein
MVVDLGLLLALPGLEIFMALPVRWWLLEVLEYRRVLLASCLASSLSIESTA